jgi:hypothetical protein
MKNPIEFTPRERFVVNYYQYLAAIGGRHILVYHVSVLVVAAFCVWRFIATHESTWMFLAVLILGYRVCVSIWSYYRYTTAVIAVLDKYRLTLAEYERDQAV